VADRKISDLTALTTPATGDLIPIVDVSEAAAADKNKSITVGELLRGAPDGTAAAPGIAFESDGGNGMFLGGTDILAFSTGGSQAVTIDASQRVGIGTDSPGVNLEVEGSEAEIRLRDSRVDDAGYWGFKSELSSGERKLFIQDDGSDRITLDASGNVGIGTTSPQGLSDSTNSLHVSSNATNKTGYLTVSNSDNSRFISLFSGNDSATNQALLWKSGDSMLFGEYSNITGSAFTERVRIDSSGRLLVGTTSGSYQLQLSTDSAGKPSTNTWTIVSDERIKEEIELANLDLCYEAIKNIPLKRFKWKDEVYTEEQAYDRRKLGWIAQDVEAVFPKAVRQHEFKYNQVFEEIVVPAVPEELDDDGNVVTEAQPERIKKGELISEEVIEDCRDLNSDQLYAAMYGAIQKLISKVETLEAEIAALKA